MAEYEHSVERFSANIYEQYERSGSGDLAFFSSFYDEIANYDASDVIANQVRTYPVQYVTDFLLSNPRLLAVMNTKAWSREMLAAGPRPDLRPGDIQMEQQGDIYFICKFLRLDAVQFALASPLLPRDDKFRILRKFRLSSPLLVLDDIDREDLDGNIFVSEDFLAEQAGRLYAEGGWSHLPCTRDKIIERMQRHEVPM